MIYLTGDTHGDFKRIERFCDRIKTKDDDVLIILGDAGINYRGPSDDRAKKELLSRLPITILCIHGNHEMRPETLASYQEKRWQEGIVFYEEEYPSLLFAKDGEIFNLAGKKAIAIGGAYSIDKAVRLYYGWGWWADEQPSEEIKRRVEQRLDNLDWKVDVVLSHTVPLKYEPTEMFLSGIDQSTVDKTTEIWLDKIEDKLSYEKWYSGHYHTEKKVDKLQMMYEDFDVFYNN